MNNSRKWYKKSIVNMIGQQKTLEEYPLYNRMNELKDLDGDILVLNKTLFFEGVEALNFMIQKVIKRQVENNIYILALSILDLEDVNEEPITPCLYISVDKREFYWFELIRLENVSSYLPFLDSSDFKRLIEYDFFIQNNNLNRIIILKKGFEPLNYTN